MKLLLAVIFIPLVVAIVLGLAHKFVRKLHLGWPLLVVPSVLFIYFLRWIPAVREGEIAVVSYPWMPSLGIDFSIVLDGLSLLFALLITGIGTLVVLYSIYYFKKSEEELHRFYVYLLLFMSAMLGVVLSDNMMVLYVFWELTSIASFLLIAYKHTKEKAERGAVKALLITVFGGLGILVGFLLLYQMTGTFLISETVAQAAALKEHELFFPAMLLILIGAFTKSAQFPFHIWLPDAMEAPTPASAYLHSATMVKAGIYLAARMTPVFAGDFSWFWMISSCGLVTLCYGSFLAVKKTDLKAILAYSTISQLGLIMLLLGIGSSALYSGDVEPSFFSTTALIAAFLHLIIHAIFKCALFMVAGIVDHQTGTRDVRRLGGLVKVMPVTFAVAVAGAMSMAGLPPLSGFLSKEMFLAATVEISQMNIFRLEAWGLVFPILAVLASIFTFVYSVMFVTRTFLGRMQSDQFRHKPKEAPVGMLIPPIVLAAVALLLGVMPNLISHSILEPALAAVLPTLHAADADLRVHLSLWHGITPELWMTLSVIVVGSVLYWTLPRWSSIYNIYPAHLSVNSIYYRTLKRFGRLFRKVTDAYMNGSVRNYLLYIFSFLVLLLGYVFFAKDAWNLDTSNLAPMSLFEMLLIAALAIAAIAVPFAQNRLAAVIMTGAIGYLVSLFYVLFRAPDLALTQMIVETVSVALFLLCFYHLPELRREVSSIPYRVVNLVVAVAVGAIVTVIALSAGSMGSVEKVSDFFVRESYSSAGGKNIVNVILVDFRGFDTLLEIMVLAAASLGIYAMIKLNLEAKDYGAKLKFRKEKKEVDRKPAKTRKEAQAEGWLTVPLKSNDVILQTSTKITVFIILTFGLYLFFAGHHHPGGGFIGGLVTAAALILVALAFHIEMIRRVVAIDFRKLTAWGLLIALLTGTGSLLFDAPFMSQTFGYFDLPILGETELATALLFDLGVYLAVLGVTMTIILQIGEDR